MIGRFTKQDRAKRARFLRRRQGGIGGSDMPRILGLSEWGNALDVYYDKVREIREEDIEDDTIHQLRGHAFEGMALDHYWLKTGRRGRRVTVPMSNPEFPNVIVSLDAEAFKDAERDEALRGTGVVETKSPTSRVFGRVIEQGLRRSELVQLQTNIAAAQREWGSFNFFNMEHREGPTVVVDQPADVTMGRWLLQTGQRFWDEHVVPRVPPVPADWKLLEDPDAPKVVDLDGTLHKLPGEGPFAAVVARMLDAKDIAKDAEEAYRAQQKQVLDRCLEIGHKTCVLEDLARLTVVTKAGRTKFDHQLLARAMPLDRDKVATWLQGWEPDSSYVGDPPVGIPLEDVGRMLFECGLDLDLFTEQGDTTQFLLPNRVK